MRVRDLEEFHGSSSIYVRVGGQTFFAALGCGEVVFDLFRLILLTECMKSATVICLPIGKVLALPGFPLPTAQPSEPQREAYTRHKRRKSTKWLLVQLQSRVRRKKEKGGGGKRGPPWRRRRRLVAPSQQFSAEHFSREENRRDGLIDGEHGRGLVRAEEPGQARPSYCCCWRSRFLSLRKVRASGRKSIGHQSLTQPNSDEEEHNHPWITYDVSLVSLERSAMHAVRRKRNKRGTTTWYK